MPAGWLSPVLILWCLAALLLAAHTPARPTGYYQASFCKSNLKKPTTPAATLPTWPT